jgi:hypothetical protein
LLPIYMRLLYGVGSWYAVPLCKNSEFGGGAYIKITNNTTTTSPI